jgi:hypothetical protein
LFCELQNATKRFGMKDETSEKLRLENDALNNANIKFNESNNDFKFNESITTISNLMKV